MWRKFDTLLLMLLFTSLSLAQSSINKPTYKSLKPVNIVSLGKAKIYYYENPDFVVGTVTVYVDGSERTALYKDSVVLIVDFVSQSKKLTKPAFVNWSFSVTSYRKGCKFGNTPHLKMLTDESLLISTDITLSAVNDMSKTKYGCTEVYNHLNMPYEQFVRLTEAKEVRMQLDSTEYKWKKNSVFLLRELRNSVEN